MLTRSKKRHWETFIHSWKSIPNKRAIVIPPSVKVIPVFAYSQCQELTNVDLPEGLESIEKGAFQFCRSLPAIVIPSSIKVIPAQAFCSCNELRNVKLPDGLEKIEHKAF
jgi:hypothetical protein